MKMMQSNPGMMKSACEMMKNMSPEQMQQMQQAMAARGAAAGASAGSAPTPSASAPKRKGKLEGGPGASAEQLKFAGDAQYRAKQFRSAVKKYDEALAELSDLQPGAVKEGSARDEEIRTLSDACHLNMSACLLQLKAYPRAVRECSAVLRRNKASFKAFYRRSKAQVC